MNAIDLSHPKLGRQVSDLERGDSPHVRDRLRKAFDMVRTTLKALGLSSGADAPKRIKRSDVAIEEGALRLGKDSFRLEVIPYVTINTDPDPANGLAGAIEVIAKEFSGPDGLRILPHRYVVTGEGGNELSTIAQELKSAKVEVDVLSVNHKLFSEAFLGAPQVK